MAVWFDSILKGFDIFTTILPACILVGMIAMVRGGQFNAVRFLLVQLTGAYLCCVFALVFLPLPTVREASELTYRFQLIPFYCVYDIARKPCMSAVCGVLFNILMTIPFGMVLRYAFGWDSRKVLIAGLVLTTFIELGQLTGLFFLYQGSYRLCDMDDIIQNTFGTWLGYALIRNMERVIPALEDFNTSIPALRFS